METLNESYRPKGISAAGLRGWGVLFLLAGIVGRGFIQNGLIGLDSMDAAAILEAMNGSKTVMALVTASLVLQAMESCAVPIFAFLLVEGFIHTGDFTKYILKVLGVALLCELPYNMAMGGSLIYTASRNPVIAMVLSLALLYFLRRFEGKELNKIVIKVLVCFSALLWCLMLNVEHGVFIIFMCAVLWYLRGKKSFRVLGGCIAAVLSSIFSLFYMAAPMSFLAIHFYNGEKGEGNSFINYLSYPVMLLLAGLAVMFI